MQDIEQERQRKQDILMSQVVEAGYDTIAFQVYCEQIKQNGSQDIDLWTFEELQKTIQDFIKKEDQKEMQQQNLLIVQNDSRQLNLQTNNTQFQIQKIQDDSNFITEVQCQLPGRTRLTDYIMENTHKQVEIIMSEYLSKSDGIISSYISFKIETKPIGWVVNRRFTDFQKLREILVMTYPCHLIPPIPGKKLKSQTGAAYLEKRMRIMELFLQNCLYHPLFKTHPLFSDFLEINDDAKLKEKFNQYEKQKGPSKPQEYTMINGSCVLEISNELSNYSNSLSDYLKNSQDIYKKTGNNFNKLCTDLENLSNTLTAITDNFNTLDKLTDSFIKQTKSKGAIEQIQQVYQELSKFVTGWQYGVNFQMKNVKENFYEFFRYHKKKQSSAYEYLQSKNQLQQKYQNLKNKLNEKKEQLYNKGDPTKWELPPDIPKTTKELQFNKGEAFKYMLPNETKQVSEVREMYAFMNHQLQDEINQMIDFRIKVYAKKFVRMGQMRALETAKFHHILANFLQVLAEMQGSTTGQMYNRRASVFIDQRYDQFFGIKPK
ncbi:unnamed protein product [Paramecium octaurelia]|uniref:PX domain-containing protein n=1 Tax=Paramecium octaurelia TaxID=43137 RepID=A0A8S1ULE4_PAROT|nr:unnamed protein product [Paramecium octaurelia]